MKNFLYCPHCGSTLIPGNIDGKVRNYCQSCSFVDYKNPLPVATAIALKDSKYLLIKRKLPPQKGSWAAPAGFIEVGETPEEACLRELKEETGMSGVIVKLIGVARLQDKEVYGDMLLVKYLVRLDEGQPVAGSEVEDVRFFVKSELPEYFIQRFQEIVADDF
jgi:ADP-ribose pyrophosphatase YjhB (NUDIX family)